ncbi:hypothetical protein LXL04_026951 [Taraxacum kok-saghyz]
MMPSSDRMSLPVSDPPPQQKCGADEQRLFKGSTMTSRGAYDAVSYMSCAGIKSKDELLYQQLYDVAKTLIKLGANVNAYRPGRHAGTPLHHAAKRGLEQMVKQLLSHGANALVMNDDCQTELDVARLKGYSNVERAIENHICLFSGWLQELYGPRFLELLAPQLLSRKVWVVILPCGARKLTKPFKLELAIYSGLQDAKPQSLLPLWKVNMDEPNFNQPDPIVILSSSNIPRRWRRRRCILHSQVRRKFIELNSD